MNLRTYRIRAIKNYIETIWQNPNSHKLENHYKFMRKVLTQNYPNSLGGIAPETIEDMLYDLIYMDRFLRKKRQGKEKDLKKALANEFKKEL